MTCFQPVEGAQERVVSALIAGLEMEFGRGAGEALAHRFLDAEAVDFAWAARVRERWIAACPGGGEDGIELDRVRIFGRLGGRWFVAEMIVDGEGRAHGMMGRRCFAGRRAALAAFGNG